MPHNRSGKTFFGYYKEDGFRKKKNLGRVEQIGPDGKSLWTDIEEKWISLYQNRDAEPGLSATAKVGPEDEWLCEAYMETDYSDLSDDTFQSVINNFLAYQMKEGIIYEA